MLYFQMIVLILFDIARILLCIASKRSAHDGECKRKASGAESKTTDGWNLWKIDRADSREGLGILPNCMKKGHRQHGKMATDTDLKLIWWASPKRGFWFEEKAHFFYQDAKEKSKKTVQTSTLSNVADDKLKTSRRWIRYWGQEAVTKGHLNAVRIVHVIRLYNAMYNNYLYD